MFNRQHTPLKLIPLLVLLIAFDQPGLAQQSMPIQNSGMASSAPVESTTDGTTKTNMPTVLQGGINHAEALPALAPALKVGEVYSDELLQGSAQNNNQWFYIPKWYAGVRHSEEAVIISRYDFATGETTAPMFKQLNRQDSRAGYQVDRNGGIWDYKHLPAIQHVESDACNAILYLKNLTPISGSDDRLVIKYEEISISVDKETNIIMQVVQQEQINTITSPTPGILRVDVSVKSFGWDGKPKRMEQSVMITKIVKPFEQIDQFEGRELRPLFKDYLVSHNLEKLVPADLAQQ